MLEQVAAVRGSTEAGLVAMVSASIVMGYGGSGKFTQRLADAGIDGLIVPDAPLEESGHLADVAGEAGLSLTLLVSPTTPPQRAEQIAAMCTGFVYLLARSGVTGERTDAPDIAGAVAELRNMTDRPIACGFGISTAEQVRAVVEHADGAIVGSALVRRIGDAVKEGGDPVETTRAFVGELASGLSQGAGA